MGKDTERQTIRDTERQEDIRERETETVTFQVERATRQCANDSHLLNMIMDGYNKNKIPGGQVSVQVEVWVQEITTISDITSDFQVGS